MPPDTDPMDELPATLKQAMTRHQAPPGLKRRVRFMLEQHRQTPASPAPASVVAPRMVRPWPQRWLGLGLSFACGAMLCLSLVRWTDRQDAELQYERQLVASHVRSLMPGHITDVASTDQHTVKPWFIGKLDYAPVVLDLQHDGFPLVGGRLDYLGGRAVAALVYMRRGHVINLFVQPEGGTPAPPADPRTNQGYALAGWTQAHMQFWAITDASPQELQQFMGALGLALAGRS